MDSDCSVGTGASTCGVLGVGIGDTPARMSGAPTPTPTPARSDAPANGVAIRTCEPIDDVCGTGRTSAWLSCNDTWQSYANGFFSTTCTGTCHRHDQEFSTVDVVRGRADAVRQKLESGAMPPGAPPPDADQRRLLTWLACGAP